MIGHWNFGLWNLFGVSCLGFGIFFSRLFRISCFGFLLAVALIAGGCVGGSASNDKQYYILEAARPGEPMQTVSDSSLEVRRFTVDAAFATKSLVYRVEEFEYETDYYRQFLIAPSVMITEGTRGWLADSGLFGRVLPVGSRIEPTHTLEGNVTALYGDFADESAPAAVMEIRVFLLANGKRQESVAFTKTYRVATPVPSRTAELFVAAVNRNLTEILTRLEADLREVLAGKTDAPGSEQDP